MQIYQLKTGSQSSHHPVHGWIQSMYITTSWIHQQFAVAGPTAWNSLPNDIRTPDKVSIPSTAAAARLTCSRFPTVAKHKLTFTTETFLNVVRRPVKTVLENGLLCVGWDVIHSILRKRATTKVDK